jgi:hypothetical protein
LNPHDPPENISVQEEFSARRKKKNPLDWKVQKHINLFIPQPFSILQINGTAIESISLSEVF